MPKAHVSEFTVRLGLISVRGRLMPLRKSSDDRRYKMVSPDGLPVEQRYLDTKGNYWQRDELGRAKIEDDNIQVVDTQALEDARAAHLPDNIMSLTVHPIADIERFLFPDKSNAYVFEPVIKKGRKTVDDPDNTELHSLLYQVIEKSGDAFVAHMAVNGTEGVYRMFLFDGKILVQKQLYFSDLNDYSDYCIQDVAPDRLQKGLTVARSLTKPFDPDEYKNVKQERLDALDEAVVDGTPVAPRETQRQDLDALLDAALAEID